MVCLAGPQLLAASPTVLLYIAQILLDILVVAFASINYEICVIPNYFIQKTNKKIRPKNSTTKASQPHQGGGLGGWDNIRTLAVFCV